MTLLEALQKAVEGPVETDAPLAARTSLKVGGAADVLVTPANEAALAAGLDVCADYGVAFQVLGAGSNLVVSDRGVRGVVIRLSPKLVPERVERLDTAPAGFSFTLSAGQPIARLIGLARQSRCVGMEFLIGIPGTIGGAVVMNAGTKAGSTERICAEIGLCEPGRARALAASEIGFGYRRAALPDDAVVSWARFELPAGTAGQVAASEAAIDADLAYRRRTQPLGEPSFGSVFRNPPGDHAARLVEACGLKGAREGGAQISALHANFIVNLGEARARDVLALMRRMQDAVLERFGVLLVPEVKLMGDFDPLELPRGVNVPREPAA